MGECGCNTPCDIPARRLLWVLVFVGEETRHRGRRRGGVRGDTRVRECSAVSASAAVVRQLGAQIYNFMFLGATLISILPAPTSYLRCYVFQPEIFDSVQRGSCCTILHVLNKTALQHSAPTHQLLGVGDMCVCVCGVAMHASAKKNCCIRTYICTTF